MKSTLKVVLCISLFTSTAIFTHAGDQHNGRCEINCSSTGPSTMQTYEIQTASATTNEQAAPVSNTQDEDLLGTILILPKWFLSFLG